MADGKQKQELNITSTAKVPENKEAEGKLKNLQAAAQKTQEKADAAAKEKKDARAEKLAAAQKAAEEAERARKKAEVVMP